MVSEILEAGDINCMNLLFPSYTHFYENNFIRTMRLRLAENYEQFKNKFRLRLKNKVKMFLIETLPNLVKSLQSVGEDCTRGRNAQWSVIV